MLFTIQRILVCTDLSEKSNNVLKNAEVLRQRTNAEVDVLYVSDIGLHLDFAIKTKKTFYTEFVSSLARDLEARMKEQIQESGIKGNPVFAEGDVADTINERITNGKIKYDLLIMGHNSKAGLIHQLLGSVARKILSSVSIPTLIIKEDLKFDKMGALVDSEGPIDWMVTSSLDFYRSFKFREMEFISLWHELPPAVEESKRVREVREKLQSEVKYFSHEHETPLIRVEAAKELQVSGHLYDILKDDKVDMAVMKRNRGQKLKKMVLGSETLRMLEMEDMNLLILPV